MSSEACHLTLSLSVEVAVQSLEKCGVFVDYRCTGPSPKLVVGICGDTSDLGSWNPEKGILCKLMNTSDDGTEVWRCRFTSHIRHSFQYRYFIAETKQNNDEYSDSNMFKILAWESRRCPRVFSLIEYMDSENKDEFTHVKFGVYENGIYIQKGWLTSNSELHLRVSGSACKFFNCCFPNASQSQHQLYISCSKYVVQTSCGEDFDVDSTNYDASLYRSCDSHEHSIQTEPVENRELLPRLSSPPSSTGSFSFMPHGKPQPVLLSTLEINRCRVHRGEHTDCWGTPYKPGDDVIFYIETNDVENTAVLVEFHRKEVSSSSGTLENPPLRYIGSARFGPFDGTYGRKASQILSTKQVPMGDLRIQYLIIHPMTRGPQPSLEVTYQHHWKKRKTIDIGHRGMGTSFFELSERNTKKPATTKENTLESFRTAVQHGADFVEMDVQLTKDRKVIVYHDFEAVIISRKKRGGQLSYLPIAIKDLNYEDLRELKVQHSSVLNEERSHEKMNEDDLDPIELQSFPLLRDCFCEVDSDLGFVIEVKYPMELKTGGSEMSNFLEYNFYVDTILREILAYAGKRRILLSCFDPNVCVMMQLKQNVYPVFQLGIAPEYTDSRLAEFERLFWSALSQQLLGVCLESDSLLTVPNVVKLAQLHGLIVLAWGEAVNCPEKRAQITALGVDGIIYDRLHEHKEKGTLSIFKTELANSSTPPLVSNSPPVVPPTSGTTAQAALSKLGDTYENRTSVDPTAPNNPEPVASPTKGPFGPKHVAIVKECIEFEKLSHSNSTTTCESIPPTVLSGSLSDSIHGSDAVDNVVNAAPSGSALGTTTPVSNAAVPDQNSSSTQRAVPVSTLA